jgi:hypothetical protein
METSRGAVFRGLSIECKSPEDHLSAGDCHKAEPEGRALRAGLKGERLREIIDLFDNPFGCRGLLVRLKSYKMLRILRLFSGFVRKLEFPNN